MITGTNYEQYLETIVLSLINNVGLNATCSIKANDDGNTNPSFEGDTEFAVGNVVEQIEESREARAFFDLVGVILEAGRPMEAERLLDSMALKYRHDPRRIKLDLLIRCARVELAKK